MIKQLFCKNQSSNAAITKRLFITSLIFVLIFSNFFLSFQNIEAKAVETKQADSLIPKTDSKQKEIEIAADKIIIKLKSGFRLENQANNSVTSKKEGFQLFKTPSGLDKTLAHIKAQKVKKTILQVNNTNANRNIFSPNNLTRPQQSSSNLNNYYTFTFDPSSIDIITNDVASDEKFKTFKISSNSKEFQKYQLLLRMIKANPEVEDAQLSYIYRQIEDTATASASSNINPSPVPGSSPVATPSATPSPIPSITPQPTLNATGGGPTPTPSATPSATPAPSPAPTPTPAATPSAYPSDPYFHSSNSWNQGYDDLWGVKKIKADLTWPLLASASAAIVAVSDTGVDYNHEDLKDVMWTDVNGKHGYDFANGDDNPMDDNGHGTHVAGTIGASIDNGKGISGVSSKVQIMAVKGLTFFGGGTDEDLANGIIYATDHGAKVINMSWGGIGDSPILIQALEYAYARNVTLVAAAGNYNMDAKYFFPANQPTVITVAASNQDDQRTVFSNWGSKIDISAPGGGTYEECQSDKCYNILSTRPAISRFPLVLEVNTKGTGYVRLAGTSMAAPHVSGAAAAVISKDNNLTPSQVTAVLQNSADDIYIPGKDNYTGFGRLNVYKAITEMNTTIPPSITIVAPADYQIIHNTIKISGTVITPDESSFSILYSSSLEGPWKSDGISLTNGGRGQIKYDVLGTWDTKATADGKYYLKVLITQNNPAVINPAGGGGGGPVNNNITQTLYVTVNNNSPGGWPANFIWQGISWGSMVSGDLDGDNRDETVMKLGNELTAFNADGVSKGNWPQALGDYLWFSNMIPAIGEVSDRNLGKEVVAASTGTYFGNRNVLTKGLYVFDGRGQPLSGWPKTGANGYTFNIDSYYQYAPQIVDLNGDGRNEIIYPSFNDNPTDLLTVFNQDGSVLAGFPVKLPGFLLNPEASVFVIKVNNETRLALYVHDSYEPRVRLLHYNIRGEQVFASNWVHVPSKTFMADVTGDNNPEIVWSEIFMPAFDQPGDTRKISFYVSDIYGNILSGWPKNIDTGIVRSYQCIINEGCYTLSDYRPLDTLPADFDNDGRLELTQLGTKLHRTNISDPLTSTPLVFGIKNNSSALNFTLPNDAKRAVENGKLTVMDTNGDGKQEVVYLSQDDSLGKYFISSWQLNNQTTEKVLETFIADIGPNCVYGNEFGTYAGASLAKIDLTKKPYILVPVCKGVSMDLNEKSMGIYPVKLTGPSTKHAWPQFLHDSEHSNQYFPVQETLANVLPLIRMSGYWDFDNNSISDCSTKSITDLSGNNQHGKACAGIIGLRPVNGKINRTVSFDGIDDYIKIDNYPVFNNTDSFTFAAWVNFDPKTPERYIAWANGVDFRIGYQRIAFGLGTREGFGVFRLTPGELYGGKWHHVAFTYDGSNQKIYIDGQLKGVSPRKGKVTSKLMKDLIIGKSNASPAFKGSIDEVRIYPKALSAAEIAQIYQWNP